MVELFLVFWGLLVGGIGNAVIVAVSSNFFQPVSEERGERTSASEGAAEPTVDLCPNCFQLSWKDFLPGAGTLWLKNGRCCGGRALRRFPLLEVSSAASALVAYSYFGATSTALAAYGFFQLLMWLTVIDFKHLLLPDILVFPLLWLGLVSSTSQLFVTPEQAIWGAVSGFMLLAVPAKLFSLLRKKQGMGEGDFKLLAALGAFLGPLGAWEVMALAAVANLVVHLTLVGLRRVSAEQPMPFGPALAVAGAAMLLWGPFITRNLLHLTVN